MGRAGIEPATLGSKVRLNELQPRASDGNVLQRGGIAFATSCSQMQVTERSLYAHPYAQVVVYVANRAPVRGIFPRTRPTLRSVARVRMRESPLSAARVRATLAAAKAGTYR
jgi:hypothetical protein